MISEVKNYFYSLVFHSHTKFIHKTYNIQNVHTHFTQTTHFGAILLHSFCIFCTKLQLLRNSTSKLISTFAISNCLEIFYWHNLPMFHN